MLVDINYISELVDGRVRQIKRGTPYLTKIRSARPNARFKVSKVALVITNGRTAWRLASGKNKVSVRETKSTYKDGQRHCSRTDPRGRKYRPAYPIELEL